MTERPEPPIPTTGIPSTWTEDQWRLYGWEYFAKHPERHPLWASQINDSEVKEVEEPLLNETSEAEELAGDDLVELSRSLESQKEIEEETDDPLLDLAKSLKESKPAPPPERDPTTSIPITKPPRPPGLPPSARNQQPITSLTNTPRPRGKPNRPPGLPPIKQSVQHSNNSIPHPPGLQKSDNRTESGDHLYQEFLTGVKEGFAQFGFDAGDLDEEDEPTTFLQLLGTMIFSALVAAFTLFSPISIVLLCEIIGLGCTAMGIFILFDKGQGPVMKLLAPIAIIEGIICIVIGVKEDLSRGSMWGGENPIASLTSDDLYFCCFIGILGFVGIIFRIWWEMRKTSTKLETQ